MPYDLHSDCFQISQPLDYSRFVQNSSSKVNDCFTHALHAALSYGATDELIICLLSRNKDAAKDDNYNGVGLPLHKALENKYSDMVILALLEANTEAAMVESANGDLPLHQAIKTGYSETVIMEIFWAYPSAAMIRCRQTGMLPLHLAASSSASPLVVKALIKEFPEALDIKIDNCTPRDLVTSSLPVESMKMICRPSLYWLNVLSSVATEKSTYSKELSSSSRYSFPLGCYTQPNYHDCASDFSLRDAQGLKQGKLNILCSRDRSKLVSEQLSKIFNSGAPAVVEKMRNKTVGKWRTPGVTPKGYTQNIVQHDYHDHSEELPWETDILGQELKLDENLNFPIKLHNLLDNVEADGHAGIISWQPHGRAFKIHDRKKFVDMVMPTYFRQTKFESFRRQLCLYGFLTISQGRDKGALYHELFLRGRAFLAKRINRQRLKGTKIRTVANPDTEPDFYSMPYVRN
jgi:hypothetical protein